MNQKKKSYLIRFIIYLSCATAGLIYFQMCYGLITGLHLAALTWSLYILCIPSGHGQFVIGAPLYLLCKRSFYTEPFFWVSAVLLNLTTYTLNPKMYIKTFPTYLLLRIISTQNPYWLIICVAAVGTFYNLIVGEHYFFRQKSKHIVTRNLLVVGGIFIFFYLAHQEMIIVLNAIL